jgi:hypothetical protein
MIRSFALRADVPFIRLLLDPRLAKTLTVIGVASRGSGGASPYRAAPRCVFNTTASRTAPVREAVISVLARSRSRTR